MYIEFKIIFSLRCTLKQGPLDEEKLLEIYLQLESNFR